MPKLTKEQQQENKFLIGLLGNYKKYFNLEKIKENNSLLFKNTNIEGPQKAYQNRARFLEMITKCKDVEERKDLYFRLAYACALNTYQFYDPRRTENEISTTELDDRVANQFQFLVDMSAGLQNITHPRYGFPDHGDDSFGTLFTQGNEIFKKENKARRERIYKEIINSPEMKDRRSKEIIKTFEDIKEPKNKDVNKRDKNAFKNLYLLKGAENLYKMADDHYSKKKPTLWQRFTRSKYAKQYAEEEKNIKKFANLIKTRSGRDISLLDMLSDRDKFTKNREEVVHLINRERRYLPINTDIIEEEKQIELAITKNTFFSTENSLSLEGEMNKVKDTYNQKILKIHYPENINERLRKDVEDEYNSVRVNNLDESLNKENVIENNNVVGK